MKKLLVLAATALLLFSCQETLEEKASREAANYTKKCCPQKVDSNLVIDSIVFNPATHCFSYCYRFKGYDSKMDEATSLQARQDLLASLKNTIKLKAYMDAGYSFRYVFHSEKDPDVLIFDTTFTQEDYGK